MGSQAYDFNTVTNDNERYAYSFEYSWSGIWSGIGDTKDKWWNRRQNYCVKFCGWTNSTSSLLEF